MSITETPEAPTTSDKPDPLDYLLDLRSIQFKLTTLYPDKTSNFTQGEIDTAGNLHLKFSVPAAILPDGQTNSAAPASPSEAQVYVIDEVVYQLDPEGAWVAVPDAGDYKAQVSNEFHGTKGPGLWLDVLPEGSLQSAGQETVGGFTTNKYSVNGTVTGQTITGSLWFDVESHALVQVELHVPAKLLSMSQQSEQGELTITLEVQKADIQTMSVPAPLATQTTP